MIIDWFTIAAQAFNFLLLIWLLKRFLYKPILRAIDRREQKIAEKLAEADRKEAAAQAEHQEFLQKNEALDKNRADLVRETKSEANAQRLRLLEEAKKEAEALRLMAREALVQDMQKMDKAIAARMRREVFSIARKTLADLGSDSLEERIIAVFLRRLQVMGSEEKKDLGKTIGAKGATVLLKSAFALSPGQREEIKKETDELFNVQTRMQFKTDPDLIGGIELVAGGHKITWNIDDYITSFEESVGQEIQESLSNRSGEENPL